MAQDATLTEILKGDDPYQVISNLTSAIEKLESELNAGLSGRATEQVDHIKGIREELSEYRMALKEYHDNNKTYEKLPTGFREEE